MLAPVQDWGLFFCAAKTQLDHAQGMCVACTMRAMDRLGEARMAWQRAQAELQKALAELEKRVAQALDASALTSARADVADKQQRADDLLQRYITYLGKNTDD